MTTGELLVARVAMKPLATLNRPTLGTVDTATKAETVSFKERTDVTAVPAMGVVAETMVALVLADEVLRKFGGDSVGELVRNHGWLPRPGAGAPIASHRRGGPTAPTSRPLNWDAIEAFSDLDVTASADAARPDAPGGRLESHVVLVGHDGHGQDHGRACGWPPRWG